MERPLTLEQLQREIQKRASLIGADAGDLPTYGRSRDFGYPHVEVDERGYHYVVVERGRELERRTFGALDDLLFCVFQSVTHAMAIRWALAHRHPTEDFRRLLFRRQIELLEKLSPDWAHRQRADLDAVLREHPYEDRENR